MVAYFGVCFYTKYISKMPKSTFLLNKKNVAPFPERAFLLFSYSGAPIGNNWQSPIPYNVVYNKKHTIEKIPHSANFSEFFFKKSTLCETTLCEYLYYVHRVWHSADSRSVDFYIISINSFIV